MDQFEITNPNKGDPRFDKVEHEIKVEVVRDNRLLRLGIAKLVLNLIANVCFVGSIILYAQLCKLGIYQQWYHLLWQWGLIVVSASATYKRFVFYEIKRGRKSKRESV